MESPIKKLHEYSNEEINALERNRMAWITTVLQCNDKILLSKKESTKEKYKKQKEFALTRIEDCEKHLRIIWKSFW